MRLAWVILTFILSCASSVPIPIETTETVFRPVDPVGLRQRLKAVPKGNGKPDRFAVIIGANAALRHQGSMSLAYQVLIESGYRRQDVFILDANDGTPIFPDAEVTSVDSVTMLMDELGSIIEEHDTLLVYVTGHGRFIDGQPVIVLNPSETIKLREFTWMLSWVKPRSGVLFIDHCYAGGTAIPKACQWVVVTVSTDTTMSEGTTFPRLFWNSFRNGSQSIIDAFDDAMKNDPATKADENHPSVWIGSCVNPSIGL